MKLHCNEPLAAQTELQTATVSEDVILGRGFDCLGLSIGDAEVLSKYEIVLRHWFGIPKISNGWAGIPSGIPNRLELKKPGKLPSALKPPYSLDFRRKKRRPWTSLDAGVV